MERDRNDCCCVLFTARQGVMIIGCLLWIGLLFSAISIGWMIILQVEYGNIFYSWYIVPNVIVYLILGIMFCKLRSAEGTERDYKVRK